MTQVVGWDRGRQKLGTARRENISVCGFAHPTWQDALAAAIIQRPAPSGHRQQNHDPCQDHQIGVKQDEHPGVVEAPFALQAARRLHHAPRGHQQCEHLPSRAVQLLDIGESRQPQAGRKCAQRK